MSVIALFSGSFCHGEEVARKVADALGYRLVDEPMLIAETVKRLMIDEGKLVRAMSGKTSIFNKFTHERERALASVRVMVAELLREDNLVLHGPAGLMIPGDISHALKVCIIADGKFRAAVAAGSGAGTEKEGAKRILKDDESRIAWVEYLFNRRDPWVPELYDLFIPMDKNSVETATDFICQNTRKPAVMVTDASLKAVEDFVLAAHVELKLAGEGHNVSVSAKNGEVVLEINKNVMMLSSLEEELKRFVSPMPGVKSVSTKVGAGFYQSDVYRKFDFDMPLPSKVLLVDDEREFAQTLSERLQMRDMGSAVVFDGEQALNIVAEDEPEVMVLDLKMPGLDGLEVLRRVKTEHPDVEVIVLTGHGSKEIEETCLKIGACAYLEKPVDIETLTRTMKEAYKNLKKKREMEQ